MMLAIKLLKAIVPERRGMGNIPPIFDCILQLARFKQSIKMHSLSFDLRWSVNNILEGCVFFVPLLSSFHFLHRTQRTHCQCDIFTLFCCFVSSSLVDQKYSLCQGYSVTTRVWIMSPYNSSPVNLDTFEVIEMEEKNPHITSRPFLSLIPCFRDSEHQTALLHSWWSATRVSCILIKYLPTLLPCEGKNYTLNPLNNCAWNHYQQLACRKLPFIY